MRELAPEPILGACLRVLHVAAYTTRNWTLSEEVTRKQINDLWEAIHEIPSVLARWDTAQDQEREIMMYLQEYDAKWKSPNLQATYEEALKQDL